MSNPVCPALMTSGPLSFFSRIKGFDKAKLEEAKGFGLKGIEERVRILGGEFFVEAVAGKGTTLEVRAKAG